jgi:serine/threonine protein kinase
MIPEVATKMLIAVKQFHELGFLHRDIKPSNFRVKDGEVYITDFGTHKSYRE